MAIAERTACGTDKEVGPITRLGHARTTLRHTKGLSAGLRAAAVQGMIAVAGSSDRFRNVARAGDHIG